MIPTNDNTDNMKKQVVIIIEPIALLPALIFLTIFDISKITNNMNIPLTM